MMERVRSSAIADDSDVVNVGRAAQLTVIPTVEPAHGKPKAAAKKRLSDSIGLREKI
jgi:hypothetical protein